MVETKGNSKAKPEPNIGAEEAQNNDAPVTYAFEGRAFVVQPVFKESAPNTVGDILLRLMQSDLEES